MALLFCRFCSVVCFFGDRFFGGGGFLGAAGADALKSVPTKRPYKKAKADGGLKP